MTLQDIYDELAQLVEEMRSFLDEHEDEDGNLSEEDAATYDRMNAKVTALKKKIDRHEKIAKVDNYLSQPTSKPILSDPSEFGGGWDLPTGDKVIDKAKSIRVTDEYRQAMVRAFRTKFRLVSNILQENVDSSGGFLVPDEWNTQLVTVLDSENVIRSLATTITTESERKIPIVANRPAASWVQEGQALTFSDATFGQITLDAHKLCVGIQVSSELLQDNAFNLENFLINEFGKSVANEEENSFINGDGVNKPTGILTSLADEATETGTANSLKADEIIDLIYSLKRPYRKSAVFLAHDSTVALLRKFKDSTSNYLWQPALVAGEPDRFMGYRIYTSEYMPKAESGNIALAFGDFSYYYVGDRAARSVQALHELYAVNDLSAFIMRERVDGILTLKEAIRCLKIK